MSNELNWYKLIYGWCRLRKPRGNGVTIPFVVGGLENYTIGRLLTEISTQETDEKIILQFCSDRKEYILSVDDLEYAFAHTLPHYGHLFIYDNTDILEALPNFETVVNFLEDRYSPMILAETFSINMENNEWEPYSPGDLQFITNVLQR